ncbi:6-phosphogluconolactonase [Deinococcus metallilatus]|uniref:6-phosphogluconolactonase n=1 Tax=Deinococcus metallilatus TaxID=1211322 RepID=A0AAJ5K542_9DEIO|nr:6-phosphogluconolactonase [Deinococcus metallilatus]MBB5295495.1 6-phosphogluconolactonase [Deinococcus metallilatus]QBY07989.1 6-phosphogluconolactonase [Deinococcus metallilatus]RXJ12882.1 6-phosphogluconolactonase [Deinococcus metallilatus]TLK27195.1 6-phosphogluconolactonase [Deinococcus metallilatus]GMA16173.1 6-phosphogluconolactonase [Deinococcus metallilatus]
MNLRVFPTPEATAQAAAEAFARAAREAVSARGAFQVALSGGSTPKLMYRALRGLPDVPWSAVHVYFSDERSVGPDSPDSNYRLAHDELLTHVPVPEAQIHRMEGERRPLEDAARAYAALLPERLDVVLLGMGDDGHTASLFPGTEALQATGRVAANWVPKLNTGRLTFTFPEINAARERWLLVTGAGKAEVLREVQAGEGDYPVARVQDPVWFLDAAAAEPLRRV